MGNEWTKGRVEQLIQDGVEESQTLSGYSARIPGT